MPGVVASDVDKFDEVYGQPADDQIFGHSPIPGSGCDFGGSCEATMVQRITGNILRLFGRGPAARFRPSVANWRQVTGQ